ncbi:uncharacterized protein VSU04_013768 [Chlamydotis macqueenii]
MFSPLGCRRGFPDFPREPGPWQSGPPPPHAHGPPDVWDKPPWKHWPRRGRGRWCPPRPWDPRPFPGPPDSRGDEDMRWAPHECPPPPPWDDREDNRGPEGDFREDRHPPGPWDPRPFPGPDNFRGGEDRRWAPHECPPPPPWDDREDNRGPEGDFREGRHPPGPWDPRPFPGPDDFRGDEEDRRWAPHECPPPPPWDDREDNRGPEGCFEEGWHPEPPLPGPGCFPWPEFPNEEQHPPWPPTSLPWEREGFWDGCPSWPYRGLGAKRCRRLRRSYRELTLVRRLPSPRPSRGHPPSSRSSPSTSGTSRPAVKEEPQCPDPPQPLPSSKDGAQSREQMAQVSPPVVTEKVLELPGPASTAQKSPAADPPAATEAAEPERAAGATPVEPGARQNPAGSHDQGSSALETKPAPPEESSAGTGKHLLLPPKTSAQEEAEPSSQSVPEAGEGAGSHPHGPGAPEEPAERVPAAASSAGEVGAEPSPSSRGRQRRPSGAGEAEAGAARDGLLAGLQPSENSQVLPGAALEPDTQPSSDVCAAPVTSPETRHPPGSGETEPAVDGQRPLCSTLPTPIPAGTDLRSAAVLARKEEIELSYQQFSLTIAVVATMLLQKEPSMEPALGLALRANLRQGRIHHLRELEDFINSYDSATLSR